MATPKSKDSKRKVRRWSFLVHVVKGERKFTFQPPAITIGTVQAAKKAAGEIQNDLTTTEQFKDTKLTVEPVGHEVVKPTVLGQINGLNDELALVTRAFKKSVEATIPADAEHREDRVREAMGKLVVEAKQEMDAEKLAAMGGEIVPPETLEALKQMPIPEGESAPPEIEGVPA